LRDTITIRHEGDDVPWDEFCYDESRWPALLARLRAHEQLSHPVALVGTFGNLSMTKSATVRSHVTPRLSAPTNSTKR